MTPLGEIDLRVCVREIYPREPDSWTREPFHWSVRWSAGGSSTDVQGQWTEV